MSKTIGSLVLTLLMLAGCTSTAHLPTASYTAPAHTSAAVLCVFRGHSMPTKANVDIQIDGTGVGFVGRWRDKRDLGAFDVPRLGAPAREGQVLLERGLET